MAATLGAACYGTVASVPLGAGEAGSDADGAGLSPGLVEALGAPLGLVEAESEGDGATLGDELTLGVGVALGLALGAGVGDGLGVVDFGSSTEPIDVPEP
jgi:hypothetical protein